LLVEYCHIKYENLGTVVLCIFLSNITIKGKEIEKKAVDSPVSTRPFLLPEPLPQTTLKSALILRK
jgi:hypothetical protein